MATISIGDIHGNLSALDDVLNQLRREVETGDTVVFLGDYIDRGMFSYHGVLRSVLQLFAKHPDHVHVLRGNHEYYVEHQGKVYGAVRPSEASSTDRPSSSSTCRSRCRNAASSSTTSTRDSRAARA